MSIGESAEFKQMVDEYEKLIDSGQPGAMCARVRLQGLANATAAEWTHLARLYLETWRANRTAPTSGGD